MKAIQGKYLSATNNRGAYVKVFAEGWGAMSKPRAYDLSFEEQATQMTVDLANKHRNELDDTLQADDFSFGTLPNGDFVATFR